MTSSVMIENSTETSPRLHTDSTNYHNWEANKPDKMSNTLSLYQLLKEIYSQTISAPATKLLWPMKASGLSIYYKIKELVLNRKIRSNTYNNLVNTWMELNMPFTGSYVKYSIFVNHLNLKHPSMAVDEVILTKFYQNAAGIWCSLVDPTFEEIKNACVIIVAQTIAREHPELGELLSNFFLTLVNNHEELVSLEEFIYLVKNFEAGSWPEEQQCRQICKDFYVFSKRFILVDFPLSSVGISLSKLGQIYIKDRLAQGLDSSFKYLEGGIDNFAVKKYHVDLNSSRESDHHQNIYVQRSINLASKFSKTKKLVVQDFVVRVRSNRIYCGLDRTLKMEQRYMYMSELLANGKMALESRILTPLFSLVSYSIDKTRGTASIILQDIRYTLDVKGRLSDMVSKYKHLRSFTLRSFGGFIEIQVSLDTLRDYGQEIKEEISSFYQELSTLNIKKVRALTYKLYKQAINKIKEDKKPVRQAIEEHEVSDLSH